MSPVAALLPLLLLPSAPQAPTPAAQAQHADKVLMIGIDGVRPDALVAAKTPHLDRLVERGSLTLQGRTTSITSSGPAWTSILTGARMEEHGIRDNSFEGAAVDSWPTWLERLERARPQAHTAAVVQWHPIHEHLTGGRVDTSIPADSGAAVTQGAVELLQDRSQDLTALFLHYDDVDHAGHDKGYGVEFPSYLAAIEKVDAEIGRVMAALQAREGLAFEDWLIMVGTDHGGEGTSHGADTPACRTVFLLASGSGAEGIVWREDAEVFDFAGLALEHLGLETPSDPVVDGIRHGGSRVDAIPGPAGYAVPILDLDADTDRQVVVDREEGQYLGHVTTTLLDDGKTILAVYPKGHGKGAIVMKRSEDGGRTWSERLPVPENWATSQEVPTLFPIVAPDGTERLIMFSGLAPIRIASSEDQGRTWTPLEPIGDFGGIVACATTMRLADGSTIALFHDDGRFIGDRHRPKDDNRFHVYAIRSEDGGLTWSTPRVIATHPRAHLCEPLLLRSPDGKRIACLMRENSRQYNSFVSFSDDEGTTWSEPQQLSAALTGDRHTGTYAPDGRLFLSFRDTARRSPTQGDWVAWVGTFADLEDGTDGQYRVRLKDNKHRWDCAYPGVELLPDGTFVCTTYGHWEEGQSPYILSTRLRLEELDALAKLSVDTWRIANPPNPAIVPVPREGWWSERQALLNRRTEEAAANHGADVIFLGDSITHGWEGAGAEYWESMTSTFSALNLGISGDRTQHVLWRLDHGNLKGLKPKVAVIMIGTNNSNSDPGTDIADGIFAILRKLRAEQPQMRILLLDIFPRGTAPDDRLRLINDQANRLIRIAADDPMIEVVGLSNLFLDQFGTMRTALMPDLLHPNEAGYRAWADAIHPLIAAHLKAYRDEE